MHFDVQSGIGGAHLIDKKIYHISAERAIQWYRKKIMRNLLDFAFHNCEKIFKVKHPASSLCIKNYISTIVELCVCGQPQS